MGAETERLALRQDEIADQKGAEEGDNRGGQIEEEDLVAEFVGGGIVHAAL